MTLAELKRTYSLFRRRYFADSELPPASQVKFRWASPGNSHLNLRSELACVWRDSGVWMMEFHPALKEAWLYRMANLILLHEMSHIHNPRADHGPWFDQEATRLGSLGAMREFWI